MNPPSPKRQRVPDIFDSVRSSSSGEKVKFLKHVSENISGWSEFVSSGGIEVIGEWLSAAVDNQETGLVHACLGALEKLPMTFESLQKSKIGRTVNESLKQCQNQVAVDRARKLINQWKRAVGVTPSKKSPPVAPVRVKPIVEEDAVEVPKSVIEPIATPPPQEDSAESALASLLESLPDLDALVAEAEIPLVLKKRISWKPDAQLVQMVEFMITESCEDLRRTIIETHGGLSALHPHGVDTDEEQRRFQESRRRERAMGGERLKHMSSEFADYDDDVEAAADRFVWPLKIKLLAPVHDPKKLKSYERQDLADIHGPRSEVIYASESDIPESPSEPSLAVYRLQNNSTIHIVVSGLEPVEVEIVEPALLEVEEATPPPVHFAIPATSFDDEFVKLNSKLQTAILDSENLLKLFTSNPALLRDLTIEKLAQFVPKKSAAAPPVSNTALVDDRKSWGVATIRSSVRNQVMNSFQPPAYHSGGFLNRDRSPSFDRPLPPIWPPHGPPPQSFSHHPMPPPPPPAFQGFKPPMYPPESHHHQHPDGFFHPGMHHPHGVQHPFQAQAPRYPARTAQQEPYRPQPRRY